MVGPSHANASSASSWSASAPVIDQAPSVSSVLGQIDGATYTSAERSPASHLPSLQHTDPTTRLGDDSPDAGPHTARDGAIGATIGGVRHQNFSHPASFPPSNPTHGAPGSRTTCDFESQQECSVTSHAQTMADFRHSLSHPQINYDFTKLTSYGFSPQMDLGESCPPNVYRFPEVAPYGFSRPQPIYYSWPEVAPHGFSRQMDLSESCPQTNNCYSLPPSNSVNRSPPNINRNLAEETSYGLARSQPELEPHTQFPMLPTATQ